MTSFESISEAQAYMGDVIDVPTEERREDLGEGIEFRTFPHQLTNARFTNIYEVVYRYGAAAPAIVISDRLKSVYEFAQDDSSIVAAIDGGFFFLADQYGGLPRQLAFNLAVADGKVYSLPVVDREAVIVEGGRMSAQKLRALGELSINGTTLSWAGSLTNHAADCRVFGNGNSRIAHHREAAGSTRIFDEESRFTPGIDNDEIIDLGLIAQEDGSFIAAGSSSSGELDIFGYDIVIRCDKKHFSETRITNVQIHSVDSLRVESALEGALSIGPLLDNTGFAEHEINSDASLGSRPPFSERPLARSVLYEATGGEVHLRLFDGRPESESFAGVTPSEAAAIIKSETDMVWGCFLDPGQSAKLSVREKDEVLSYGNAHYLQWPRRPGEKYEWVPKLGRPVASVVALK